MNKENNKKNEKLRKYLTDRLSKLSGDDCVITPGKLNRVKEKFEEDTLTERLDIWGDDKEVDLYDTTKDFKTKR